MGVFGIGLYPSDSRITRKTCGTPFGFGEKTLKTTRASVFFDMGLTFLEMLLFGLGRSSSVHFPVDAKSELFDQGNVITLDLWQALQPLPCTYPIHDMTFSPSSSLQGQQRS